jgi:EmrB/QacA subfamily drug resistance transporter
MSQPAPPLSRARRSAALAVLCLCVFLGIVENTILNVAVPSLRADLGASTGQLQWITDAYVLVFAGFVLVAATVADRVGRKGALLTGLGIIGVFSVLAAFATTPGQLVAYRAVLGLGAAFVFPTSLSILVNIFTDPVLRGRAIAVWGAVAGASAAAGPILGGLLLQVFPWGSIFLVNVVIVALIMAGAVVLPTSRDPAPRRVDVPGSALSILTLTVLVWSIIQGQHSWTDGAVLVGFALSAVLLTAFVMVEKRVTDPMLDLDLFGNAGFCVPALAVTAAFFVLNGTLFAMTMYLQSVRELTPLQAGLCMLPGGLAMMAVSRWCARLTERIGARLAVAGGFATCTAGLLLISRLASESGTADAVAAVTVFYAGLQLISAPAATAIMNEVPKEKAGAGSAVNNLTRQLGAAFGIAVLGSMLSTVYRGRLGDYAHGAGLPSPTVSTAMENVGAAVGIAHDSSDAGLLTAAKEAFTAGLSWVSLTGATLFVVAAVATALALPGTESSMSCAAMPRTRNGRSR